MPPCPQPGLLFSYLKCTCVISLATSIDASKNISVSSLCDMTTLFKFQVDRSSDSSNKSQCKYHMLTGFSSYSLIQSRHFTDFACLLVVRSSHDGFHREQLVWFCVTVVRYSVCSCYFQFELTSITQFAAHQENKRLVGFVVRTPESTGGEALSTYVFESNSEGEKVSFFSF